MARRHDFAEIKRLRSEGRKWREIVGDLDLDVTPDSLRGQYSEWRKRSGDPEVDAVDPAEQEAVRLLTADEVSRITSLDDLLQFFEVDTEEWEVRDYRINKWEQHSVQKGIVPLYQVRANLIRRIDRQVDAAREVVQQMIADAAEHMPRYALWPGERLIRQHADPALFELAIMDPHIGMLAWGPEVGGNSYDSGIAVRDYAAAVEHLLAYAHLYPTERILYVVGNDLLHVDGPAPAPKGTGRGGATAAGTVQDVDSRLAKAFTLARRAVVEGIDLARSIAPVDVMVVPGNHDPQQMYRLGEVLAAWYRHDDQVEVIYGPNKRKYYGWGRNAWMFTHGEEYKRQRDSLPLIFATEAPAELWVGSTHREIHTGHNHAAMAGAYHPTSELTESRSIRTRSLPALTSPDSWHHEEGYHHRRTATALIYRKSGGVYGTHEYHP